MKINIIFSLILLSVLAPFIVSAQAKLPPTTDATKVLQRVSEKLTSINTVSYQFYRDVNYKSEAYRNEIFGPTFLKFDSAKDTAAFKFQVESDAIKQVFDGTTSFFIDKGQKTMKVDKRARISDFSSSISFFVNSIVTLRRSIPTILAERDVVKTVADTIINKMPCYVVSITFDSKVLGNLGQIKPLTTKRDITYQLIIEKNTYLPIEVIQTNNSTPKDYVLTRFSDYKINSASPAENTWHYFNYIDQYKPLIKNQ